MPPSQVQGLRVLVAPDKFKGSLSASQAAEAIAGGILDAVPDCDVVLLPVADGGEGTIDAVAAAGAAVHELRVRGPLGHPVDARWAALGEVAVIEMAQAAGLQSVSRPTPATAEAASTFGVGEVILEALGRGYRRIIIGAGGVASSDGGAGALTALGLRIVDDTGASIDSVEDLARAAYLDGTGLDRRLVAADITIATDVMVPLLGPKGAAQLFGPQKGADPVTVVRLEHRLTRWNALLKAAFSVDPGSTAGAGAAGGFASGFTAVLRARIAPGTQLIGELVGLEEAIATSELVVVGEGSLDEQSLEGKAPIAIARSAQRRNIPVLALSGRVQGSIRSNLVEEGIVSADSLLDIAVDLDDAVANAYPLLRSLAARAITRYASR